MEDRPVVEVTFSYNSQKEFLIKRKSKMAQRQIEHFDNGDEWNFKDTLINHCVNLDSLINYFENLDSLINHCENLGIIYYILFNWDATT